MLLCFTAAGSLEAAPRVGDSVPNFSLRDLNGQMHTPATYQGKVLVLYLLGWN
jgi:peroxiredoxin